MDFDTDSYAAPEPAVKTWPTRAIGAGIVLVCVLLILSLLTYNIGEMGWSALNPTGHEAAEAVPCTNLLGVVGLYLAGMLYALLGAAAVYILLLLATLGVSMILSPTQKRLGQWVAFLVMMICACALLGIQDAVWVEWASELCLKSPGGLLGYFDGVCIAEPLLTARWAMVLMVLGHGIALIYFARETPRSIGCGLREDLALLYARIQEKRRLRRGELRPDDTDWKNGDPADSSTLRPTPLPAQFTDEVPPAPAPLPQPGPQAVPQGQLPPRVRPNIQTTPPPLPRHEQPQRPTPAPPRFPQNSHPAPDPLDAPHEEESRIPEFPRPQVQRPAPAPRPEPAPRPTPAPRPARPATQEPRHISSGDNLLDLMPEVEEEVIRSTRSDMEEQMTPQPSPRHRNRLPLSPAAQAALDRYNNGSSLGDEEDDIDTPPQPQENLFPKRPAPVPAPTPAPAPRPLPQRPEPEPAPRPAPAPRPVQPERPAADPLGIVERLRRAKEATQELPEDTRDMLEDYPLPPYDMLTYKPPAEEDTAAAREEMYSTQQSIIETLASFRIDVEAGDITRGPSITRYEFYPPKGLKLNRITNLADNLRMATQSKSINILAPIPGKNTVGIELENDIKSPVYLRELLQSEAFHSPKLRIPVALGKDVYGAPVIGDLAAMPHTLVAGTTGSGKSVCVNSMILSMLYKFRPDQLRLILVDPKVVEMQPYKKLPHLACPVVTNAARVIGALRWAVNEMEHRYKLFSKIGVRNFEDFNNRPEDFVPEPEEEETHEQYNPLPEGFDAADAIVRDIEDSQGSEYLPEEEEQGEFDFDADEPIPAKLPYIVIIIDELADLMMQVKEDLENYIARLTQKARAAGIHLVAATQTPRANVITGIIKANIPSRLAFKVASPLDSRVILDTNGAENLLGKGDFLFLSR